MDTATAIFVDYTIPLFKRSTTIAIGQLRGGQGKGGRRWQVFTIFFKHRDSWPYCLSLAVLKQKYIYGESDSSFICIPACTIPEDHSFLEFPLQLPYNMKYALTLAALAAVARAHTIFGQIVVGGTQYRELMVQ